MGKIDLLLKTYDIIKDSLDDEDDYIKLCDIIRAMSAIDVNKAFDMWYVLLKSHENIIKSDSSSTTPFMCSNIDILSEKMGEHKFDELVYKDNYLYDLIFRKYCKTGYYVDSYPIKMIERLLHSKKNIKADTALNDLYNNRYRIAKWSEVMDRIISDIGYDDFKPEKESLDIIAKWVLKITNKKERAQIIATMMASDADFNYDIFDDANTTATTNNTPAKKPTSEQAITEPLIRLINENSCMKLDSKNIRSVLSDYFANDKLYVNILYMVFESGIVEQIKNDKNIDDLRRKRFVSVIQNNYGITDDLALLAVNAWINALK